MENSAAIARTLIDGDGRPGVVMSPGRRGLVSHRPEIRDLDTNQVARPAAEQIANHIENAVNAVHSSAIESISEVEAQLSALRTRVEVAREDAIARFQRLLEITKDTKELAPMIKKLGADMERNLE
jgi:hypothetical protein